MGKSILFSIALFFSIGAYAQVPPPPPPTCSLQVVVHIIHNNGPENIADSQVMDAMRILSEDYSKTNADTINIIPQYKSIAADSRVRFRLATVDPQGNPTTGIERIVSTLTYTGGDSAKFNQWPPNRYVNIWLTAGMPDGVAGYAFLPDGVRLHGSRVDGIIVLHNYFSGIGTSNQRNARVITFLMGHYLGLKSVSHTDTGINTCGDDGILDTPPSKGFQSCPTDTNAAKVCHPAGQDSTGDPGVVENYQNFMDYVPGCGIMFTAGQCQAIHNTLTSPVADRNQLCTDTSVGINELLLAVNEFSIYPNPATTSVQLSYQLTKESMVRIELLDALGRNILIVADGKHMAGQYSTPINTSSMLPGIYLVKVTMEESTITKQLIIRK